MVNNPYYALNFLHKNVFDVANKYLLWYVIDRCEILKFVSESSGSLRYVGGMPQIQTLALSPYCLFQAAATRQWQLVTFVSISSNGTKGAQERANFFARNKGCMSMNGRELEEKAMQIWQKQHNVALALQDQVKDEVRALAGEVLAEKLPPKQNVMLRTVRKMCVNKPEGVSLTALAQYLGVSAPTASVMVDTLVELGYLERQTAPHDRRARRIRLTPMAEDRYKTGDKATLSVITRVAENLDGDFLDQWHDVLSRVESELGTFRPGAKKDDKNSLIS